MFRKSNNRLEAFAIERRLCKLLIVDDEVLIRQGIKHYLNWEEEGFTVIGEAANGQEALQMIEQSKPDLVITDIVMPMMDGEQLTKAIKTRYPDIEVVVLSSFGEFDYVRSSFQSGVADYMLKPKLEPQTLLNVLRKAIGKKGLAQGESNGRREWQRSAEDLLEKIAAGFDVSGEADREQVRRLFPHPVFRLFALAGSPSSQQDASASLTTNIRARLPETVPVSFPAGRHLQVILVNGKVDLLQDGEALAMQLTEGLTGSPTLLISLPYDDFSETNHILTTQILPLARQQFYAPDNRWLIHEQSDVSNKQMEAFNLNQFTDKIKHWQFATAFGDLQQHVRALCANACMDVQAYKSFLNNMIFTISVLLDNLGYGSEKLDKEKFAFFQRIEQAESAMEAAELLFSFMNLAERGLTDARPNPALDHLQKMLAYIEQNYAEPLSLKDVANHFHFNPSYLSNYFSTHTGEGFVEYVNKIRIGKAAELLRTGSEPIAEIGSRVGFADHSYFCKVFKKITGQSPSQYRRMTMAAAREQTR